MNCPKCNGDCWRESADVGVGIIYGPWHCSNCGWSEDSDKQPLVEIKDNCIACKQEVNFFVPEDGYKAWKGGAYIQQAFPMLSSGKREFLISKICEPCFDKICNMEEEKEIAEK